MISGPARRADGKLIRDGDRMDVRVDPAICEANGRCVTVAPEMFSLDDDEILHITDPPGGIEPARVERAVASCPLSALSIRADPGPGAHP
jgi:ferredoxin